MSATDGRCNRLQDKLAAARRLLRDWDDSVH